MPSNSQQATPRSVPIESLPNMESIHVAYSKKRAQLESVGFIVMFICSFFVLFSCLFSLYSVLLHLQSILRYLRLRGLIFILTTYLWRIGALRKYWQFKTGKFINESGQNYSQTTGQTMGKCKSHNWSFSLSSTFMIRNQSKFAFLFCSFRWKTKIAKK